MRNPCPPLLRTGVGRWLLPGAGLRATRCQHEIDAHGGVLTTLAAPSAGLGLRLLSWLSCRPAHHSDAGQCSLLLRHRQVAPAAQLL